MLALLILCMLVCADGCGYTEDLFRTSPLECTSQTTSLFSIRWLLETLVVCAVVILLSLYHVLEGFGLCCGNCCVHQRSALVLSVAAAAASIAYADFLTSKLDAIEDNALSNPLACFVCPNGKDDFSRLILAAGSATSVFGTMATVCVFVVMLQREKKANADKDTKIDFERLITRPIDIEDGVNVLNDASV